MDIPTALPAGRLDYNVGRFDLSQYWKRFPAVLRTTYKRSFAVDLTSQVVFADIPKVFEDVRSGRARISVDDVMAIFGETLPFAYDWTKPDRAGLEIRMTEKKVADSILDLRDDFYSRDLITNIWHCFRELSLTSLVLHHVYPAYFAVCSHHLASLLYITAPTVPQYYIQYCTELREWSQRAFGTRDSVVKAEFALWTWYRLAHYGASEDCERHRLAFFGDPWIQQRRAMRIAESLKEGDLRPLDLARSFLDSLPTVSAMIAWREFEVAAKAVLRRSGDEVPSNMPLLIRRLPLNDQEKRTLRRHWNARNDVMHEGRSIKKGDAEKVLNDIDNFIETNLPHRPSQ